MIAGLSQFEKRAKLVCFDRQADDIFSCSTTEAICELWEPLSIVHSKEYAQFLSSWKSRGGIIFLD